MKSHLLNIIRRLHSLLASKAIVVLGDSHAQVFGHDLFRINFPFIRFDVCSIGGATISGLDNPNSKTGACERFREKLASIPDGSQIILMLGEVDTGFVIWYRAEKHGEPVEAMLQKAIDNYIAFIEEVAENHKPIVISTPLPTITDDNNWGEVANLRKEVSVSQVERTRLTLRFNEVIKSCCSERNIDYLNLDPKSLGDDGLVTPSLLNDDKLNHHYSAKMHVGLIVPKLKVLLSGREC